MTDIDAEFTEFKAPAHLEAIRQEHEPFLTQLEALAVLALASGDWWPVHDLIASVETWQGEQALLEEKNRVEDPFKDLWAIAFNKDGISTDSLSGSGADHSHNRPTIKE